MKKATIYIIGQIGTSKNPDGTINVKGVELQDVVSQVEDAKKADSTIEGYDVIIKSLGGSVQVGKKIAAYISKLPNAYTIASEECASMGTEIHLSVPKENRSIIAGTLYSIHNPLLQNVSGNAGELAHLSDIIKESEKAMVKMYTKATGLEKIAVEGLMNQETSLTADECLSMGFVSEITPAQNLEAVAFFDNKKEVETNQNNNIMNIIESTVAKAFAKFSKTIVAKQEEIVASEYPTAQGVLKVVHANGELAAKDVATIDGVSAPVGEYTLENKTVVKISEEGNVAEVIPFKEVEKEGETDAEKIASLEAKLAASEKEKETMVGDFETKLESEIVALKKLIGSNFVPANAKASFAKGSVKEEKEELNVSKQAVDRKATYTTHAR